MTTTTATRKPLVRGEQRSLPIPGTTVVVYVNRNNLGDAWNVWVEQGTYRPEGWAGKYDTEDEARAEFTRAARAFAAHGSDVGIERRANELGIIIQQQEGRKARRMCNHAILDAAEAEADALMPLGLAAVIRTARQPIAA